MAPAPRPRTVDLHSPGTSSASSRSWCSPRVSRPAVHRVATCHSRSGMITSGSPPCAGRRRSSAARARWPVSELVVLLDHLHRAVAEIEVLRAQGPELTDAQPAERSQEHHRPMGSIAAAGANSSLIVATGRSAVITAARHVRTWRGLSCPIAASPSSGSTTRPRPGNGHERHRSYDRNRDHTIASQITPRWPCRCESGRAATRLRGCVRTHAVEALRPAGRRRRLHRPPRSARRPRRRPEHRPVPCRGVAVR
jgi:hypothetical protein